MSRTKTFYHEEICANMRDADEEMMWFESFEADQTEIDWFDNYRIDCAGYEEFTCELCGKTNTSDSPHPECHDREQAYVDNFTVDDLPF